MSAGRISYPSKMLSSARKVVFSTVVTREKQKKQRTRDRLTWPCEMIVVTETTKAVLHEEFNSSLHGLVGFRVYLEARKYG